MTVLNIYTPNVGRQECIKQILTDIKREIGSNNSVDFNTNLYQRTDHPDGKSMRKQCL